MNKDKVLRFPAQVPRFEMTQPTYKCRACGKKTHGWTGFLCLVDENHPEREEIIEAFGPLDNNQITMCMVCWLKAMGVPRAPQEDT